MWKCERRGGGGVTHERAHINLHLMNSFRCGKEKSQRQRQNGNRQGGAEMCREGARGVEL